MTLFNSAIKKNWVHRAARDCKNECLVLYPQMFELGPRLVSEMFELDPSFVSSLNKVDRFPFSIGEKEIMTFDWAPVPNFFYPKTVIKFAWQNWPKTKHFLYLWQSCGWCRLAFFPLRHLWLLNGEDLNIFNKTTQLACSAQCVERQFRPIWDVAGTLKIFNPKQYESCSNKVNSVILRQSNVMKAYCMNMLESSKRFKDTFECVIPFFCFGAYFPKSLGFGGRMGGIFNKKCPFVTYIF